MDATLIADHGALLAGILVAGFASGFAGGLFGLSGAIVTVPALYAVFQSFGVPDDPSLKTAIGTSLGVIIVTSIRSLTAHHRAGHVDGDVLRAWAPWVAFGAAAGGIAVKWAPVEVLTLIFAGAVSYIAWRRLFGRRGDAASEGNLLRKRLKIPVGAATGLFASLMGGGGGAVGVFVMTLAGRPMHQAIGTSAGFGIAVALPGVVGFVSSGWSAGNLPAGSIGYVNAPAFAAMAVMAAVAAPLGAKLAHRADAAVLSTLFGGYVLLAVVGMLWDVFSG